MKTKLKPTLLVVFTVVPVLFGFASRFQGLGTWPLAVDEFYTTKAVELIRHHGTPTFPDGGIYKRGPLFLYIVAVSTWILGLNEFAVRVPAILFNLACIPALFLLARKRAGKTGALLLVIAFSLSVWEVEFSRFARMYTAFQCAFLWFLYFFHEAFFESRQRYIYWVYGVGAVAVLIHEAAAIIALLLFLPLGLPTLAPYNRSRHFVVSCFLLLFNFLYNGSNLIFSMVGEANNIPSGLSRSAHTWNTIIMPDFSLLRSLFDAEWKWLVILGLLVISACMLLVRPFTASDLSIKEKSIFLSLIILSLLQLYGILVFVLMAGLLSKNVEPSHLLREKLGRSVILVIAGTFIYWLLLGLVTTGWQGLTVIGDQSYVRKVFALLLHYPRVGENVIFEWMKMVPSTVIITTLLVLVWPFMRMQWGGTLRDNFTPLVLVILVFMLGVFKTSLATTRYSFFLYPIVLMLWFEVAYAGALWALRWKWWLPRRAAAVLIFVPLVLFVVSEDFSISHLRNVDNAWINFRMGGLEQKASHYYARYDFRSPAEYVNQTVAERDIIISALPEMAFYLRRGSYVYYDSTLPHFGFRSVDGGRRERWTQLPLVYSRELLQDVMNKAEGTIWLIEGEGFWERTGWTASADARAGFDVELAKTSIDNRVKVFRINRKARGGIVEMRLYKSMWRG